ncbi:hypothetical protein JYU20_01280 [Bacteroidales bacterium AH-315-I05]|nr:hypothetical protein [Bacteroidales bacterium AH-315-I05]
MHKLGPENPLPTGSYVFHSPFINSCNSSSSFLQDKKTSKKSAAIAMKNFETAKTLAK